MLSVMQVAYPRFYAQQSETQMQAAVGLWAEALGEYPEEAVRIALGRVIKESPYPPTIADIAQRVEGMKDVGKDGNEELWTKFVQAISNGYYNANEMFAELPYVCQKFVGSPRELRAMSQMDEDVLHTVTRGQFMKRVEILKQREKLILETPREVLELLGVVTEDRMLIEGKEEAAV